ncbi:MAG: hypothetical protein H6765_02710 [Candidatus Peribacteria bacterium]|nr:MAG: hypothetical protein H6765_02710 [Candidatus Peribacteria bacterium]
MIAYIEQTNPTSAASDTRVIAVLRPWLLIRSGAEMPAQGIIEDILEPMVNVEIVGPEEFSGNIM